MYLRLNKNPEKKGWIRKLIGFIFKILGNILNKLLWVVIIGGIAYIILSKYSPL